MKNSPPMTSTNDDLNNNSVHISSDRDPQLSIVIPAYNEEGNLRELYSELMKVLPSLNLSWEIAFVDDGSKDRTWEEIRSLHGDDERVKGIRLSKNFGHQYAVFAGLCQAVGEIVITLDADLQHPPEIIKKLVDEWRKGSKIVQTIRLDPEDFSLFKKVASKLFYKIFSALSGVSIESGMADFRLMDRQVVDSILQFKEQGLFLRGLVQWVGYQSSTVEFQSQNRFSGLSKYTLKKMVRLASFGITSFSIIPLRISTFIGAVTALLAFAQMFWAVYLKLFTDRVIPGWATIIGLLTLLFGILFVILGVVGEYIGQILMEVRNRPRFLMSEQVGINHTVKNSKS